MLIKRSGYFNIVWQLAVIASISGIAFSGVEAIWAIYLNSFLRSEAAVGFITAGLIVISILSAFLLIPLLEKHSKIKVYSYSAAGIALGYLAFAFIGSFYVFLAVAIPFAIARMLYFISFGIILRDQSDIREIGKAEGLRYALENLGWIFGPLLAGFLLRYYGFSPVFLMAAILLIIALVVFRYIAGLKDLIHAKEIHPDFWKNVKAYFENRELVKIYLVSGGIGWWWSVIFIYLPLFILKNNLDEAAVGIFLFLVSTPLLLEYLIGKTADKTGFKIFLTAGFSLLAIFSLLAFALENVYAILLAFVLASFGAACIESTRESYFFRIISEADEERFYPAYLTCHPVLSAAGNFATALILLFLPFKFAFLGLSLSMLFFAFLSSRLKERMS